MVDDNERRKARWLKNYRIYKAQEAAKKAALIAAATAAGVPGVPGVPGRPFSNGKIISILVRYHLVISFFCSLALKITQEHGYWYYFFLSAFSTLPGIVMLGIMLIPLRLELPWLFKIFMTSSIVSTIGSLMFHLINLFCIYKSIVLFAYFMGVSFGVDVGALEGSADALSFAAADPSSSLYCAREWADFEEAYQDDLSDQELDYDSMELADYDEYEKTLKEPEQSAYWAYVEMMEKQEALEMAQKQEALEMMEKQEALNSSGTDRTDEILESKSKNKLNSDKLLYQVVLIFVIFNVVMAYL